jgi:hypothetical protein
VESAAESDPEPGPGAVSLAENSDTAADPVPMECSFCCLKYRELYSTPPSFSPVRLRSCVILVWCVDLAVEPAVRLASWRVNCATVSESHSKRSRPTLCHLAQFRSNGFLVLRFERLLRRRCGEL